MMNLLKSAQKKKYPNHPLVFCLFIYKQNKCIKDLSARLHSILHSARQKKMVTGAISQNANQHDTISQTLPADS